MLIWIADKSVIYILATNNKGGEVNKLACPLVVISKLILQAPLLEFNQLSCAIKLSRLFTQGRNNVLVY